MTRDADDETLSGRADALDAGTQFGERNLETSAARDDDDAKTSSSSVAETLTFETLRDFSRETNCVEARTGPHCQGVLMLAENRAEDGGLQVVPGFHSVFERWVRDGLRGDPSRFADAHDDWRRSRLVARAGGAGSFKFGDDDAEIQKRAFRVAAREGSYVVWDQRLAHGTAPNDSSRARVAQFVKGFRKSKVSAGRLARRAERVRLEIGKAGAETQAAVSELGRKLFGLR
jgi:ectoine hydroxylase-related dioxygenase (phytanoyl-CoA dioxygenase family)